MRKDGFANSFLLTRVCSYSWLMKASKKVILITSGSPKKTTIFYDIESNKIIHKIEMLQRETILNHGKI